MSTPRKPNLLQSMPSSPAPIFPKFFYQVVSNPPRDAPPWSESLNSGESDTIDDEYVLLDGCGVYVNEKGHRSPHPSQRITHSNPIPEFIYRRNLFDWDRVSGDRCLAMALGCNPKAIVLFWGNRRSGCRHRVERLCDVVPGTEALQA